jgi:hypothetical protein
LIDWLSRNRRRRAGVPAHYSSAQSAPEAETLGGSAKKFAAAPEPVLKSTFYARKIPKNLSRLAARASLI